MAGGVNTYTYVGGNPIGYVDPTGEIAPVVFGVIHLARLAAPHVARFVASKFGKAAITVTAKTIETYALIDGVVEGTPPAAKLSKALSCPIKKGPKPNNGIAKKHGNNNHNNAIDNKVLDLKKDPLVTNIRKNQQQVAVKGDKVGLNRPDIQYDKNGCHHCVEYDHVNRNSVKHGEVIRGNDSNTIVELNRL